MGDAQAKNWLLSKNAFSINFSIRLICNCVQSAESVAPVEADQ